MSTFAGIGKAKKHIVYGNSMATKNQIAHNLWITKAIRIMNAKSSKQNYLEHAHKERVGIGFKRLESGLNTGFVALQNSL